MTQITQELTQNAMRQGIVLQSGKTKKPADTNVVYAAVIEMANLGYCVAPEQLQSFNTTMLKDMINNARIIVGADRNMVPVYPGFPKQVQELSTMTLLVEQILHYWSAGTLIPDYPNIVRDAISIEDIANITPKTLEVKSVSEASTFFVKELTQRKIALSDSEQEILRGAVKAVHMTLDEAVDLAKNSSQGENIQTFVKAFADRYAKTYSVNQLVQAFAPVAHTSDELLRIVLSLATTKKESVFDTSYDNAVIFLMDKYANTVNMVNVNRASRRAVMARLGELSRGYYADRVVGHRNLWRRVMRMIHPYSIKMTDDTKRVADIIHENVEYKTFNSSVEEALAKKDAYTAATLLAENQVGNFLRRLVSLMRLATSKGDQNRIVELLGEYAHKVRLSTLISSYNAVLSTNNERSRVIKVAGLNNAVVEKKDYDKVDDVFVAAVADALRDALRKKLANAPAPVGAVGAGSDMAMPLMKRDASSADKSMDRGEKIAVAGKGTTVRMFNHWRNNQHSAGYIDTGAVVLDNDFNKLDVITWNTWAGGRDWATYSGDKLVGPGDEAVEYIDVNIPALRKTYVNAQWIVMTLISYSNFPLDEVDVIAGAMLRNKPNSGEVFDARTLASAYKPSTSSLNSVPLAVNILTGEMVWLDSSDGAVRAGASASDMSSVGDVLYDEIVRPRLSMGELAILWAEAHGVADKIDIDQDVDKKALMNLLD